MNTKNIFSVGLVIFIFLFLIKAFDISYPLTIVNTTRTSELSVIGEGKVEATPDMAYVEAGITINNAQTVDEAQKTINKVNNEIIKSMKSLGINKEDIKTSNYSIYPNYSYENGVNKIAGYNGNVTITIKTKKLTQVSKIIEDSTKAGANQIQGVRFTIDKPENYREKAREEAIKNAKEQAQKLANKLGIKLGKVVNIVESTPDTIQPLYRSAAMGLGGTESNSATIEPGSQTITSTVTLYFEKK
jgi:hypothetical protein